MPARSPRAISGAPGPGSPPRPTIDDTYRLARRPLDLAVRAEAHLRTQRKQIVQLAPNPGRDRRIAARLRLDADRHSLATALRVEHDLVLVAHAGVAQERRLDLARVEVHPFVDHHVVGASAQPVDPERGPSTVAGGARADARQVVGPVADQRQALPRQRRDDQLALRAVRHDRAGRRVDDLRVIVILPDVDTAARGAIDAEPRSARLGHADDVEGANVELLLDARPQLVGPHLRAEDAHAE